MEELRRFRFLDNDAIIQGLTAELPRYWAVADGADLQTEEEKLQWWSRNEANLPNWSSDFSEFCGQLENTRIVRDAASFSLGEHVYEYNTTLKSLLDRHVPLKTKTITLHPTALWYTEEIRSEKKKRRALERRWRSSKRESDYSRFKEQCLRVNALIKKTKVDYYSGIIRESSNNP